MRQEEEDVRVHSHTGELDGRRSRQDSKIAVTNEIKGTNGAIQRATHQSVSRLHEGNAGDVGSVVLEGDVAVAGVRVPQLDLRVLTSSGDDGAIGTVVEGGDVVVVTLLLEDVGLRLPLPHEELAHGLRAKGNPRARQEEEGHTTHR